MLKRILFFLVLLFAIGLNAQINLERSYPRLVNYYLEPIVPSQNASLIPLLARYQLLVLDMEQGEINPSLITGIRNLNPQIKICAYVPSSEIDSVAQTPQFYPLRTIIQSGIQNGWYARTSTGDHASFWPRTLLMNCSQYCPVVNGQTWNSYLAAFVSNHIFTNPLWDGVFLDCVFSILPWNQLPNLDLNGDHIIDDFSLRDIWWRAGINPFLANLRAQHPTQIMIGNPAQTYNAYLNGSVFEEVDGGNPNWNFNDNWATTLLNYLEYNETFQAPRYNMLLARDYYENQVDYKHARFTLCTALLADGYYGIDKGPQEHGHTWWYDEFNVNLGEALESLNLLGENQVLNPSFDQGLAYWDYEAIGNCRASLSLAQEAGNSFAKMNIQYVEPNLEANEYYKVTLKHVLNPNLNINTGERYKVSFKAKANISRPIEMVITKTVENWGWLHNLVAFDLSTTWQDFECIITPNVTTTYQGTYLRICFFMAQATGQVYIDDVKLEPLNLNGIHKREFEHGIVLCNPTSSSQSITLSDTFYRILGTQSPSVNNGTAGSSFTIPAQDGLILLRNMPNPLAPHNLQINRVGSDVLLSWDAVTQNTHGGSFTPDAYIVLYNGSNNPEQDYYFHGLAHSCQYTHYDVADHAPYMFYRVLAYKADAARGAVDWENIPKGISEQELLKVLKR